MMVPEDCLYTEDHEWVYIEDEIATIGISEYAAGELGDIVYVELPDVGADVQQTDSIGTIEAVKTVAELFSPISGKVIEINDSLIDDPEIINRSPYEDGWFVKIEMNDKGELDNLLDFGKYQEFLGENH
ncbi:MAG: glycine cleavage system protein GcvH [Candidatus Krumholzibacteriota bacterium]|nr:glycine cleavage system protein GcvH [Candidatus Krumholzibacteriota bacterium]